MTPRPNALLMSLLTLPGRIAAARRDIALLARIDDRGLSDMGLTRHDLQDASTFSETRPTALAQRGREREALALRARRRASA